MPNYLKVSVLGWSYIMVNKDSFGELSSKTLEIGDIVEWSRWNSDCERFDKHFGILLEIKNEIKSNRLISIARVAPLNGTTPEMEFFALSLRLVSKGNQSDVNHIIED